ncbi:Penicillin-binding protein PbpB [Cellulomonas sp. T2.31MG-18]|uniref:peptidoglycan D,D-transpeptidase FtsI family protein n=1 Tax=Cellulomonas sp. T2.31MG-18 TaxID=3157619 RepID=UPI0035F0EFD4
MAQAAVRTPAGRRVVGEAARLLQVPTQRGPRPVREAGPRGRVTALVVVLVLVLATFAGRLVWVQGIAGPAIAKVALEKRLSSFTVLGQRGQITDAAGVPLATSVERYDISVNQRTITKYRSTGGTGAPDGAAGVAARLAPVLGANPAELGGELAGSSTFRYVAKGVLPEVARSVQALRIDGVMVEKVADRVYPKGTLAGNIVGFVNADGKGLQGLEYTLNSRLTGTAGSETYERGAGGQAIPGGYSTGTPAVAGQSARLTILSDLQWKAQEAADAQKAATGADSATVVVEDVATGALYAVADSGSIDPNKPGAGAADALSRAVSDAFEPGSTGKVITMAALLESGLTTPTSQLSVPYEYTAPNGQAFHDAEQHGVEQWTTTGILAQSSNAGTVMIGQQLTKDQRYSYLTKFGLGTPTGVELPGETAGILHPADQWDGRTQYTVLFGQGLSVNALQATNVYATVANGGVRPQPHLIAGWTGPDGTYTPTPGAAGVRVVSPQTAQTLLTMLGSVVNDGTGTSAAVPGYQVAGKTGTAQDMQTGGITASFIGVVPADAPRLVVGVFVQNPKTSIYGGVVAAPVFSDVAGFALSELGVAPSGSKPSLFPTTW